MYERKSVTSVGYYALNCLSHGRCNAKQIQDVKYAIRYMI